MKVIATDLPLSLNFELELFCNLSSQRKQLCQSHVPHNYQLIASYPYLAAFIYTYPICITSLAVAADACLPIYSMPSCRPHFL